MIKKSAKKRVAKASVSRPAARRIAGRKLSRSKSPISFQALEIQQSGTSLYLMKGKADVLYDCLSINRRETDKDVGYQRALSVARVEAIKRYIKGKNPLPGAIVVAFRSARFEKKTGKLVVPPGKDVGWVIDGQHRLAGAEEASRDGVNIELPVVAFVGLSEKKQIEQFVTINREGKNVPTSLYLDLLGKLPTKKPGDFAKERASDIASELRRNEDSPFLDRISVTTAPKAGQVSLANFVRKLSPLVLPDKGMLHVYTAREQVAVVDNYFKAIRNVFPKEFDRKESIFFRTVGFGALWNAFSTVFNLSLKHNKGFTVTDAAKVLKHIETFDFDAWREYGSGNQAEVNAGEDMKAALALAFREDHGTSGTLRV